MTNEYFKIILFSDMHKDVVIELTPVLNTFIFGVNVLRDFNFTFFKKLTSYFKRGILWLNKNVHVE